MRAEAGRAEIYLYEVIDSYYGISAKRFAEELKNIGDVTSIDVRINSPGGEVFEGTAIHTLLKRHPAKVTSYVDGIAASMASVVAMAGDEIVIAAGAYMMIHNPVDCVFGEADDMRDVAEMLDKVKSQLVGIYAKRTGKSAEEIAELMDAETWFTADEAVASGFADRTADKLALAATYDLDNFTRVPQKLRGKAMSNTPTPPVDNNTTPPAQPQAAGYAELKAGLPGADAAFICSQLEAKATLADAQSAWMTEQNSRLEAANNDAEQSKKKAEEAASAAAKVPANNSGVEPLGSGTGKNSPDGGDPIARFNELVTAKIDAGKKRDRAISDVIDENPELHEEYLAAYNAAHKK